MTVLQPKENENRDRCNIWYECWGNSICDQLTKFSKLTENGMVTGAIFPNLRKMNVVTGTNFRKQLKKGMVTGAIFPNLPEMNVVTGTNFRKQLENDVVTGIIFLKCVNLHR